AARVAQDAADDSSDGKGPPGCDRLLNERPDGFSATLKTITKGRPAAGSPHGFFPNLMYACVAEVSSPSPERNGARADGHQPASSRHSRGARTPRSGGRTEEGSWPVRSTGSGNRRKGRGAARCEGGHTLSVR